ncbi:MAG: Gmad2 immunoglobulin-like domain-containing protein [Candidatus Pacebacteria bacterium]|nr:Gmad2 immunoglobulin-like domain-containing protein [Candidatus Paceibacterota bacterium]
MKKIIFWIVFIIIIAGAAAYYLFFYQPAEEGPKVQDINNFEECAEAGYPVMESYPRQCRVPEGETFTEDIGNEIEKSDLIRVNTPRPNYSVASPLLIEGEARGYWFFEATFPIKLLDGNGKVIAQHYAQAQEEWMTEDFVPFTAELNFISPDTKKGTLVLEKDNPSGLPENADELRIPVFFQH